MGELALMDGGDSRDLEVRRDPLEVLDEAKKAAKALKDVIDAKPKPVIFGGEKYLEFEDWQTVGRFYGITPRIVSTAPVQFGTVEGWEARAEAYHVPTGRVVASAEAMCLNDEPNWSTRPASSWHYMKKSGGTSEEDPGKDELIWEKGRDGKNRPKKIRIETIQPVPRFQLRSMAQTRAGAKALRNALAWVVVLAGYRPTPAEEMTGTPRETAKDLEDYQESAVRAETSGNPPTMAETSGSHSERATATGHSEKPTADTYGGEAAHPHEDKDFLLGRIKAVADKMGMKANQRAELWKKHCSGATPETVDQAALSDLYAELVALSGKT